LHFALGASFAAAAVVIIMTFLALRRHGDRDFATRDLHDAVAILNRVSLVESRCFKTSGRFAPSEESGASVCGSLIGSVASGVENGFAVEVRAAPDAYTVSVHSAANFSRAFSLYLDEKGVVHLREGRSPATVDSQSAGTLKSILQSKNSLFGN
jgi:hypothetical protein